MKDKDWIYCKCQEACENLDCSVIKCKIMQNEDLKFKALVDAVKDQIDFTEEFIKKWELIKTEPGNIVDPDKEISNLKSRVGVLKEVVGLAEAVERDEKKGLL